ncbi:MAG: hypothetical protein A2808_02930 [Candidatus Moranbacteria bacterium RIFCSPHIGHO2_01_FULL_55_24]|nr:MAG: hypothetical protein A2808_02930 [Candidatus Moranbacteria bacterium RIFCSPHIGHO2_01_FULL_55_24]
MPFSTLGFSISPFPSQSNPPGRRALAPACSLTSFQDGKLFLKEKDHAFPSFQAFLAGFSGKDFKIS